MKKILIALIAAGAVSSAMAEVNIYGNVSSSVERTRGNTGVVNSDGTYIGFKGKEALSPDTNAVWQIEQGVKFGSSSNTNFDVKDNLRDSYVGLESNRFGRVLLGKQTTPYSAVANQFNHYKDRNATLRGLYGRNSDERTMGTISYQTPDFYGVKANAAYSAMDKHEIDEKTKTWSTSLEYQAKQLGVEAAVAYEREKSHYLHNDKRENYIGQLGYNFANGAKVGAGYEHLRYRKDANNKFEQGSAMVTGKYPVASNLDLIGGYTRMFEAKENGQKIGGAANVYTAGAEYHLSKRTTVGANYSYIDNRHNGAHTFKNDNTHKEAGKDNYTYGATLSHSF